MSEVKSDGHTKSEKPSKPKPVKIDLAYLLDKYGPKKKRPPKPVVEEPKYYESGFSVKFKLSHAYKYLEKQEQDVAAPVMSPRPKMTPRMLRRLAAGNPPPKKHPNTDDPKTSTYIDRGTLDERRKVDLEKYKKIGQLKREKTEVMLEVTKLKQDEMSSPTLIKKNVKHKVRPVEFWRSLSNRKGTEKDEVLSQDSEYEDRTFITNVNPSILKSRKGNSPRFTQKKVIIKQNSPRLHVENAKAKNTVTQDVDKSRNTKPVQLGMVASKAVREWDRRRLQRREKKLDQKDKIKQASNAGLSYRNQGTSQQCLSPKSEKNQTFITQNSTTKPAHAKHSANLNTLNNGNRTRRCRKNRRPKSAPPVRKQDNVLSYNLENFTNISKRESHGKKRPHSRWSKCLDAMYLDVPDNFSEEELVVEEDKKVKEGNNSTDGDEENENEEKEVPLQYRPSEYLYGMCNCQRVAKKKTLNKLQEKNKKAGVIEIFGCPEENNPNDNSSVACPFCSVFPQKRIQAWINDVEAKSGRDPFWMNMKF